MMTSINKMATSWQFVSPAGLATVWRREVIAALQYWPSIFGGLATPLLLFSVFGLALGERMPPFGQVSYRQFIIPAVVTLQIAMGTYYQAAYSTYYARNFTMTLEELLTSPLLNGDIILGRALGGMTMGLLTSLPLLIALSLFSSMSLSLAGLLLSAVLLALAGLLFSTLGMGIGLLASNEFLLINASNLVIMPLVFLSDTFFPLSMYSPTLNRIIGLSPVTFLIGQMRQVLFEGVARLEYWLGLLLYLAILLTVTVWMFNRQMNE